MNEELFQDEERA